MKYQDWHEQALSLSSQGLSGRKIAKQIGKAKSSVNDLLKADREGLLEGLEPKKKELKILFWDLESSLIEGYFFGIWQQNIPVTSIKKHAHLLSNSWAFNDGEVQGVRLTPDDVRTSNDYHVVKDTIDAINKADLIVTFNGKKFDIKLLNTRALFWGLQPVKYPKHIDLMQDAKRQFKFPSNSMQNISMYLGLGGKIQTGGISLWQRCANYDDYEDCDAALEQMLVYGRGDIKATRELFYRLKGWSKTTPNIGLMTKVINGENLKENTELLCVHCGSNNVTMINQKGYTNISAFELYRCGENVCKGISRVNGSGKNLVNYI